MSCMSPEFLGHLLVQIIVICAVVAIIRLLVPFVLSQIGAAGGVVAGVINIVLWAIIAIAVVWFCIDLLGCVSLGRL